MSINIGLAISCEEEGVFVRPRKISDYEVSFDLQRGAYWYVVFQICFIFRYGSGTWSADPLPGIVDPDLTQNQIKSKSKSKEIKFLFSII